MKDEIRQGYISLLRGMLSPAWQKPSDRKIETLLKSVEDAKNVDGPAVTDGRSESKASPANRRRLTALITAGTKLDAASRLVKEATIDVATSGLLPVEVREEARKIATDIDEYVQRRITTTIELIP